MVRMNTRCSGWCCRSFDQSSPSIAVFVMIPVWNDLWFPLILAPAENVRTVTLGTQQSVGSFGTNWQAVLAALTLALVLPLVFYAVFSRQLLSGLTAGAIK
jgi:raffinose/stachyose/melibiose transport system permease protein